MLALSNTLWVTDTTKGAVGDFLVGTNMQWTDELLRLSFVVTAQQVSKWAFCMHSTNCFVRPGKTSLLNVYTRGFFTQV